MQRLELPLKVLFIAATLCLLIACKREVKPPPPLPLEQMPAELLKSFASAAPGVRDIVEKINVALNEKDFPGAYQGVQILCSLREATDEQRMMSTRAMLTLRPCSSRPKPLETRKPVPLYRRKNSEVSLWSPAFRFRNPSGEKSR
jgi:hypothetical protein